jgi:iron complex outermembrane receptor protein
LPVLPVAAPRSRIEDKGVYVFDRASIGERWQVMAGLRRSDYSNVSPTTRYEADETLPAYAVMYKVLPRFNLYASYLEGLEEGGQAPQNAANAFELLQPLKSRQREIGAKAEVGRGVQLTASYFDIDRPAAGTNPLNNRFELTGVANYRGIELSGAGPLAERWSMYASALLLDAEQTISTTDPALVGKTPENTPRRTFSVFAEHRPAWSPGLALSAGAYYVGARPVNPLNQAYVGGYTRVDFGARYTVKIGAYRPTLQIYVENALDTHYWSAAGNNLLAVGQPRTIKFSASLPL